MSETPSERFNKTRFGKYAALFILITSLAVAAIENVGSIASFCKSLLPNRKPEPPSELEILGRTVYFASGNGTHYSSAVKIADPQCHDLSILAEYAWLNYMYPEGFLREKYLVMESTPLLYTDHPKGGIYATHDPEVINESDPRHKNTFTTTTIYDVFLLTNSLGQKKMVYFDVSNLVDLPNCLTDSESANFKTHQRYFRKAFSKKEPGVMMVDELFHLHTNQVLVNVQRN